jgi:predicted RNA-binding Zn-ribbon protein involved in translation (DUF1610 family)
MKVKHLHIHACPQCGANVWRVHRQLSDRVASLFRNVHRYRCREVDCGWEGTIARPPRRTAARRSTFARWTLAGLAASLVVIAFVRLHPDPRVVEARPGICAIETAPRYVPSGESYDGFELGQDGLSKALAGAGLSVRQGCAWGVPGRSPYKGSVKEALVAARLPEEVVSKIDSMVAHGAVSDRVEIRRDSIRTVNGKRQFDTKIVAMGFGQTLCFATQVNFRPGHVEIADLYDAQDASGTNYAVMIPYVCGNVSVLAERAERPEVASVAGTGSPEAGTEGTRRPSIVGGGQGVWVAPERGSLFAGPPGTRGGTTAGGGTTGGGNPGGGTTGGGGGGEICRPDNSVQAVPEPGTIAVLIAALAAMSFSTRLGRRNGRCGKARE